MCASIGLPSVMVGSSHECCRVCAATFNCRAFSYWREDEPGNRRVTPLHLDLLCLVVANHSLVTMQADAVRRFKRVMPQSARASAVAVA